MNQDSARPKVLVVDDEESIRLSCKYVLDSWYEVSTVNTSAKALEMLEKEHFDIILLDIVIEGEGEEGSLSALKIINKKYPQLPVVILSGSITWMQKWDHLRKLGACGYISKPFTSDKVKEMMDRCINGEKMDSVWR